MSAYPRRARLHRTHLFFRCHGNPDTRLNGYVCARAGSKEGGKEGKEGGREPTEGRRGGGEVAGVLPRWTWRVRCSELQVTGSGAEPSRTASPPPPPGHEPDPPQVRAARSVLSAASLRSVLCLFNGPTEDRAAARTFPVHLLLCRSASRSRLLGSGPGHWVCGMQKAAGATEEEVAADSPAVAASLSLPAGC